MVAVPVQWRLAEMLTKYVPAFYLAAGVPWRPALASGHDRFKSTSE